MKIRTAPENPDRAAESAKSATEFRMQVVIGVERHVDLLILCHLTGAGSSFM